MTTAADALSNFFKSENFLIHQVGITFYFWTLSFMQEAITLLLVQLSLVGIAKGDIALSTKPGHTGKSVLLILNIY